MPTIIIKTPRSFGARTCSPCQTDRSHSTVFPTRSRGARSKDLAAREGSSTSKLVRGKRVDSGRCTPWTFAVGEVCGGTRSSSFEGEGEAGGHFSGSAAALRCSGATSHGGGFSMRVGVDSRGRRSWAQVPVLRAGGQTRQKLAATCSTAVASSPCIRPHQVRRRTDEADRPTGPSHRSGDWVGPGVHAPVSGRRGAPGSTRVAARGRECPPTPPAGSNRSKTRVRHERRAAARKLDPGPELPGDGA